MGSFWSADRLNVGDLVKIRQSWSNLGNRVGVIVHWWDDTPIGDGHTHNSRYSYEVRYMHTNTSEDFYDYQLELLSEAKRKRT